MQKIIIQFLIILLLPLVSVAQLAPDQETQVDSLKQIINNAQHDTTVINTWMAWYKIIYHVNSDSAFELNQKADSLCSLNLKKELTEIEKTRFLELRGLAMNNLGFLYQNQGDFTKSNESYSKSIDSKKEIDDKYGANKSLINIGTNYYFLGDYDKAIEFFTKSLKISELIKDRKGVANALNNIGIMYQIRGDYINAIDYFTKSLKIKEEIEDKKGMSSTLNNIGMIYSDQEDHEKALDYNTRALKISEEIDDKRGMAGCLNSISAYYEVKGDYDKSIEYLTRSLKLSEEIGNKVELGYYLANIGNAYREKGETDKALDFFTQSLVIREEIGEKRGIASSLISLGVFYNDIDEISKALDYGKRGFTMAQELGYPNSIRDASNLLWDVNKKLGRSKESLEMHELYIATRDSMTSEDNQKASIEQEYKYAYEKQAVADSIKMVESNRLKDAMLLAEKAENKQHEQQQYFLYGGLALALLFGGFIFNRFKLANKQKAIIEEQKEKVDEAFDGLGLAHKEIRDSINYAERIQRSFLATKELLDANLDDYFVFFQPKDVVSGDFYWAGKLDNGNFAMVNADSTGHGVPGAIMSILNISSIESAVKDKLTHPAAIFNESRKTIINRLKKDGSADGGKDGMDASIICFDPEKSKFSYTAAQNPIWIIRDGELIEIKPEKMPIGKHDNDNIPFIGGEFETQKGDQIYTLTDGFQDQFGGPKGKKFMVKRMREFILSISHLSMKDQNQQLKAVFTDWIGELEQIDDVCVIGVKI